MKVIVERLSEENDLGAPLSTNLTWTGPRSNTGLGGETHTDDV